MGNELRKTGIEIKIFDRQRVDNSIPNSFIQVSGRKIKGMTSTKVRKSHIRIKFGLFGDCCGNYVKKSLRTAGLPIKRSFSNNLESRIKGRMSKYFIIWMPLMSLL